MHPRKKTIKEFGKERFLFFKRHGASHDLYFSTEYQADNSCKTS